MNFMEPLEKHLAKRALEEDEYFNEKENLIYCKKCNTPRQIHIERFDRVFEPYVMCDCQTKESHREKEEEEKRKLKDKVKKLKAKGLQDKSLYDYCFSGKKEV